MSIQEQIVQKILREQELLMGPVAWLEASKVKGLRVIDQNKGIITFEKNSDNEKIINSLVDRFGKLFGRAGIEVCKEAVLPLIADLEPSKIPVSLK